MERNCAYGGSKCNGERAYQVTEKWGAAPRVVHCCAKHYPGNKTTAAPVTRVETATYIIEPIARG